MKYLIVNGSPNKSGNTAIMAKEVMKELQNSSNEVIYYDVQDGDLEDFIKYNTVDVLVIASPIYWGGITGVLKSFIDKIIPDNEFYKKLKYGVSLINAEYESNIGLTSEHLQLIYKYLGIDHLGTLTVAGMQKTGDMLDRLKEVDDFTKTIVLN